MKYGRKAVVIAVNIALVVVAVYLYGNIQWHAKVNKVSGNQPTTSPQIAQVSGQSGATAAVTSPQPNSLQGGATKPVVQGAQAQQTPTILPAAGSEVLPAVAMAILTAAYLAWRRSRMRVLATLRTGRR